MEDANFEFLLENYPRIYNYCKKMDFLIFWEFFDEAAVNARRAVEGMVKLTDKHFTGDNFADYKNTDGKSFMKHAIDLAQSNHDYNGMVDDIGKIWRDCSESAHDSIKEFKRSDLIYYAELAHKIIKHLFKEIENFNVSSIYKPIKGDEEWIIASNKDSEEIFKLREEVETKNAELIQFKKQTEDLQNDLLKNKREYQKLNEDLDLQIRNMEQLSLDKEALELVKSTLEAEAKRNEENFLKREEELTQQIESIIKDSEEKERQLAEERDKLKERLDNSDIFDVEDFAVSSAPALNIKYPPIYLPEKNDDTIQIRFDGSQKKAIECENSRLVIDAGPGSGKTTVIIKRIEYLMDPKNNENAVPDSLLVITFSEKAAEELKERLKDQLDVETVDKIHVSTIHSFCRTLLRDNSADEIKILNEDTQRIYIKSKFADKFSGPSYIPPDEFYKVFEAFSEAAAFECYYDDWIDFIRRRYFRQTKDCEAHKEFKNFLRDNGWGTDDFEFPESRVRANPIYDKSWYAHKYLAIAESTKEYHEMLKKESLYDFNRLQTEAIKFLKENIDEISLKYKNILIDEFQDTDVFQKEIFELLLKNSETFTIVGDMDQCIYRWRGSEYKFLEEFSKKPGFKKVVLDMNYRSGSNIVEFNEKFILSNRNPILAKKLKFQEKRRKEREAKLKSRRDILNKQKLKIDDFEDEFFDENTTIEENIVEDHSKQLSLYNEYNKENKINNELDSSKDANNKNLSVLKTEGKITVENDSVIKYGTEDEMGLREVSGFESGSRNSLYDQGSKKTIPAVKGTVKQKVNKLSSKKEVKDSKKATHPGDARKALNKNKRKKNLKKSKDDIKHLTSAKENDGEVYYLDNISSDEQASRIVKTIQYLHNTKGVKYSDIGLLFRSTLPDKTSELINKLEENGINYVIRGNKDLDDEKYYEIKSFLYLIWYITNDMKYYDLSDFVFAINYVYKFKEETQDIIINSNVDPKDFSMMRTKELEELGIKGKDLDFLDELNSLKRLFYLDSSYERPTILTLYNKLFKITNYVDDQFKMVDSDGYANKNNPRLLNLALISTIIESYMQTIDPYDLDGVFKYLIEEYGNYSSPYNDKDKEDAVQILTIFKAKGLEFPVVFLCTLQEFTLPLYYKKKALPKEGKYSGPFLQYPIFNRFLKYKTKDDESKDHDMEERRVIYVADTRAEDLLIISGVKYKLKKSSTILKEIVDMGISPLNTENLDTQLNDLNISTSSDYKAFKKPTLSYSSFNDYADCKHKYDLKHNFGFMADTGKDAQVGIIVHDILNKIHTKVKNDGSISDEYIEEIIANVYKNNPFLFDDDTYKVIESIKEYWNDYGSYWEILDSELSVSIKGEKYDFTGQIDLIIKEDPNIDEITIVDFKTTKDELLDVPSIREKYQHQLELYYHALSRDPHFAKYKITNLKIFQIDGEDIYDADENNFEIDTGNVDVLLQSLDYVVDQIYDGIFDKNLSYCKYCDLRDLCHVEEKSVGK